MDLFPINKYTFNLGWDENAYKAEKFDDVREIPRISKKGVKLDSEADVMTKGSTNFVLTDPDGNVILIDQHI